MIFARPESYEEAIGLLARDPVGTRPYAGGVEVGFALRRGTTSFNTLLDTKHLPGAYGISPEVDQIRIGPATKHDTVATSATVLSELPLLAAACGSVGSTRIRMQGTIGGNWGHGHQHTDPGTAAVALGGAVDLSGPDGERSIDVEKFWLGPYSVARKEHELIVGLRLRTLGKGWLVCHRRVEERHRPPNAIASVALLPGDALVRDIRIGIGGVPQRPVRLRSLESQLQGLALTELGSVSLGLAKDAVDKVDIASDEMGPRTFKVSLIAGLIRKTLACLANRDNTQSQSSGAING